MTKIRKVLIKGEYISVSASVVSRSKQTVLFLFGGSRTQAKERFTEWSKKLAVAGINSVSFDYSGTGQSSGDFYRSSLKRRIQEASGVLKWIRTTLEQSDRITVCGGSMGATIALGVAHRYNRIVKNLILFCPAAYAKEAHATTFGPEFTQLIKKQNSWKNSPAFEWLGKFTGRLLFIIPDHDEVISADITEKFRQSATNAGQVEIVAVKGATHQLLSLGKANEAVREYVYRRSIEFLRRIQ